MTGTMIDMSEKRDGLPEFDPDLKCACGGETMPGQGLAGGGFGSYTICIECGNVVSKTVEEDDDG